jgi:hypothetical protein
LWRGKDEKKEAGNVCYVIVRRTEYENTH